MTSGVLQGTLKKAREGLTKARKSHAAETCIVKNDILDSRRRARDRPRAREMVGEEPCLLWAIALFFK
jgi:Flp pilus assembly protein TadD